MSDAIKKLAEEAFANHSINTIYEDEKYGMWNLSAPSSSIYFFNLVIMTGGTIVIAGDVGNIIMRVSKYGVANVITWIRGALNSPYYMMEKAAQVCRESTLIFDEEKAKKHLKNLADDEPGLAKKIREEWLSLDESGTESEFFRAYYCVTGDVTNAPSCQSLSPDAQWSVECLRTFIRLYDAAGAGEAVKPVTKIALETLHTLHDALDAAGHVAHYPITLESLQKAIREIEKGTNHE